MLAKTEDAEQGPRSILGHPDQNWLPGARPAQAPAPTSVSIQFWVGEASKTRIMSATAGKTAEHVGYAQADPPGERSARFVR